MNKIVVEHCIGRTILAAGDDYHDGSSWIVFTDSTSVRLKYIGHETSMIQGTVFDACGMEMYAPDNREREILSRLPYFMFVPQKLEATT